MGNVDGIDEKTFRVNFSGEGAAKLREAVRDKLKEFMGDYTDDTLVEYVVVLLRNGRRKDEAKNELNVFLGDDSDSFVSWLWDHLSSNLNLYVQQVEVQTDEVPRKKSVLGDHASKIEAQNEDLELEKGTLDNSSRGRHKREWKGLGRDEAQVPPLTSAEFDDMHIEEKTHHKVNHSTRSRSPKPQQHKKRNRHEEQQRTKREAASRPTIAAPRRLLQFAVRDAVESLRSPGSVEPSQKRLRSVVSTSSEDSSFVDQPRRLLSIARVPNAMSTVVRAVQEAAEDVRKIKPSVSVFDRLGRDMDVSGTGEQVTQFNDFATEDAYEGFNMHQEHSHLNYIQRSDYGGHIGSMNMMESETGMHHDLISENEGYDDVNIMGGRVIKTQHASLSGGLRAEDSIMMQYKVVKNSDDSTLLNRIKDQNLSLPTANASRKIAGNVKSFKPPHYKESRSIDVINNRKLVQENEVDTGKPGVRPMKENITSVTVGNGNAKLIGDIKKDPSKTLPSGTGSHAAGHLLEDADSRTIFVNNVHFAATKDNLSRHFNKFGEILKVVIVTDATTGQPKGSAYIEFMQKEAADNALSLDGTSFMSRLLKVVKRSTANLEATPNMTWPRITRGSPYSTARFSRAPFPRGIAGGFRPHLAVKPGARSLQWKRDAQGTAAESASQPVLGNNFVPTTPRSLTYVRTDPKPDGNSSAT